MTPSLLSRQRRSHGQSGQGSGEYLGIVGAASILVIGLVGSAAGWAPPIGEGISYAICRVANAAAGGGSCAAPGAAEEINYVPDTCTVGGYSTISEIEVEVWYIHVGAEEEYAVLKYTRMTPEGPVEVIEVMSASMFQAGADIEGGANLGESLKVEGRFALSGTAEYGETWIFEGPTAQADYDAWAASQERYEEQGNPFIWFGRAVTGNLEPEPRAPDKTTETYGGVGEVEGQISAGTPGGTGSGGKDDDTGLGVDVYVNGEITGQYSTTTDNREGHEGEFSTMYTFSVNGEFGSDIYGASMGGGFQTGVELTGSVQLDQRTNPDGGTEVTSITFTSQASGHVGGGVHGPMSDDDLEASVDGDVQGVGTVTTTVTLNVTDENRAIVEEWLAQNGNFGDAMSMAIPATAIDPTKPSDDPFSQLLYEEGIASRNRTLSARENGDWDVSGPPNTAGISGGSESQQDHVTSVEMLAPSASPNGNRTWIDHPDC